MLALIGELNSSLQLHKTEGINLLLYCYKKTKVNCVTEVRKKVWKHRVSQNNASAPTLESLSPTNEALLENLKKAHIQASIWHNSFSVDPPTFNPIG